MKVYLIKCKETNSAIRWEGSLKEFMLLNIHGIKQTDGERRTLANTKDRDTYYKGYKILFFGEEEPQDEWEQVAEDYEEEGIEITKMRDEFEYDGKEDFEKEIKCKWKTTPTWEYDGKEVHKVKRNVLFIPDLHCPFDYVKGIEMAKKIYEEEECTEVVFLGDVLDFYSISEYGKSPDFMSQTEERVEAKEHLKAWHNAFPIAKVCTGNHTMRIKKKFDKAGLSSVWMKSFGEMFDLDGWDFQLYHEVGKFIATHGMGQNAKSRSKSLHKSVICGHLHSKFESFYDDGLWSIYGGCMVDIDSRAFEYGKFFKLPKLGFVVIKDIDNIPVIKMIPVKYEREDEGYEKMHEMW